MPFRNQDRVTQKVKPKSQLRTIGRWAAAAAVILAVGTWAMFQISKTQFMEVDGSYTELLSLSKMEQKSFLIMTEVVSYPESFTQTERLVLLDGEAYFDVAKEKERQFVIQTDYAKVMVLGTEFDVSEDDDAQSVEVFVTEGKVRLQPTGSKIFIDVEAGESALYDHKTGRLERSENADMNQVAWHTKRLQFAKTSIPKVIQDIEAAYDVSIDYAKTGILRMYLFITL